ncbi:hypothetical protein Tco_0868511 [Tanacetum coccineum]
MVTLADKAILSGADNRPPMLEKDMYDSWKSIMELYMMNRQHGRMILESVENGPLIWPTIEENGVTRPKKYSELSATEAIQADCDIKATNIILQGLPPEVYALQGDDQIDAINHMMSFLSAVVISCYPTTNNQLRNSSNPRQQATINDGRVTLQPIQGRQIFFAAGTTRTYTPGASGNALTEVHNHDNVNNNMINQAIQAMPSSEQSNIVTIQNSKSSAQQDALILSVIEQLKTQVVNCTKINLDNKSVNDTLTVELERYKEQVKVLKEGQNVDLKSNDNILDSSAQSVEIDRLKQTLSEHLKEKESLMQTVTLLKMNFSTHTSYNFVNSLDPTLSSRPTKVEVPKELPKVNMVNTSLKKPKHHLLVFDVVSQKVPTATAIKEGSWGSNLPKLVLGDERIPFV